MDETDFLAYVSTEDEDVVDFLEGEVGPLANASCILDYDLLSDEIKEVNENNCFDLVLPRRDDGAMDPEDLFSLDDDYRPITPETFYSSEGEEDNIFFPLAGSTDEVDDLARQCNEALKNLQACMVRSQESRQKIIRSQALLMKSQPIISRLQTSMEFVTGSRATLTAGLEHSRYLLMSYARQMETM